MIHWFIFNFIVLIVSFSLVFNIRNDFTVTVGWILILVAVVLMVKDFFAAKG